MIKFEKNVKKFLRYNRSKYIDFLSSDSNAPTKWYGVSFQLPGGFEGKKIDPTEYMEKYEPWFKNIVSKLDTGLFWTVNHENVAWWLPNEYDNLTSLRTLFKENNIPNKFQGAILFTKDDLLKFSKDLISYPFAIFDKDGKFYEHLDISHGELQFVIKISNHMNIDLLSTNEELLREVVKENSPSYFILKEYQVVH